jgi:hypothetical protein
MYSKVELNHPNFYNCCSIKKISRIRGTHVYVYPKSFGVDAWRSPCWILVCKPNLQCVGIGICVSTTVFQHLFNYHVKTYKRRYFFLLYYKLNCIYKYIIILHKILEELSFGRCPLTVSLVLLLALSVWRFLLMRLNCLGGGMFCGICWISGLGWSVRVEWCREYMTWSVSMTNGNCTSLCIYDMCVQCHSVLEYFYWFNSVYSKRGIYFSVVWLTKTGLVVRREMPPFRTEADELTPVDVQRDASEVALASCDGGYDVHLAGSSLLGDPGRLQDPGLDPGVASLPKAGLVGPGTSSWEISISWSLVLSQSKSLNSIIIMYHIAYAKIL